MGNQRKSKTSTHTTIAPTATSPGSSRIGKQALSHTHDRHQYKEEEEDENLDLEHDGINGVTPLPKGAAVTALAVFLLHCIIFGLTAYPSTPGR